jgi:serine protease AprX
MAKKNVIAYFMHETERAAAQQEMPSAESTDSYVMGEVEESRLDALKAKGLIIQELQPVAQAVRVPFRDLHGVTRAAARAMVGMQPLAFAGGPAAEEEIAPDMTKAQYFLLWLAGPLLEQWRADLAQLNVDLLEAFPTGAYKARLEPNEVQAVSALPFVTRLQLFGTEDTGPDVIAHTFQPSSPAINKDLAMLCFDIRLHQPNDAQPVLEWLKEHGVAIAGSSNRKIRVYLLENAPELGEIPALPEVAAFEQYVAPRLHNDRARVLLGIDKGNPSQGIQETGAGQIIGVADTGLDEGHPDFQGRIAGVIARGRSGDASDPHGHGTHVSGSVLGDGNASGGSLRGAAPGAKLFFQSLLDAQGELGGLPLDLGELFDEAYQNGARIHNNSWGSATQSRYTINASEVDDFVASHRDMLVVISAGNEGTAATPRKNAATGFVDWLSIGSPASSKNALTVGASRSDRTHDGLSSLCYRDAWPNQFPDDPIGKEKISGDPQSLAGFSSRGPCDDYRIKPDLVAPGTDIASTKSNIAPLRNYWAPYPGNARYAFMGGTSMSAPLVSGCAALVREYYMTKRNHEPSAALLKATLINGTSWLSGADSIAPAPGTPNYHQGFGRINMADTLPNASRPNLQLHFADDWKPPPQGFAVTGERKRYQFSLPAGGGSLRICLAYTDLSARALQNDLNLFVQLPNNKKIMGNVQLPNSLNIPDPQNNIEIVRIDSATAGTYIIQVAATNLLKGPQDFALVVTGENISPLGSI